MRVSDCCSCFLFPFARAQAETAEETARLSGKTLLHEVEDRRAEMEAKHKQLMVRPRTEVTPQACSFCGSWPASAMRRMRASRASTRGCCASTWRPSSGRSACATTSTASRRWARAARSSSRRRGPCPPRPLLKVGPVLTAAFWGDDCRRLETALAQSESDNKQLRLRIASLEKRLRDGDVGLAGGEDDGPESEAAAVSRGEQWERRLRLAGSDGASVSTSRRDGARCVGCADN